MRLLAVFLVVVFSSLLFGAQNASAQYQMCPYGYGYVPCWQLYPNMYPNPNMYQNPYQPAAPSMPNPSADYNPYGGRSGYGVEASDGRFTGGSRGGCYQYVRGSCEATR